MRLRTASGILAILAATTVHAGVVIAPDLLSERASHVLSTALRSELAKWDRAARPAMSPESAPRLRIDGEGRIFTAVSYDGLGTLLSQWLTGHGAHVTATADRWDLLEAWVPPVLLLKLAEHPQVRTVRKINLPVTRSGSCVSEGVAQLRADTLHALGITGTGVKVGVISDGADNVALAQATGDLPPEITVLPGFAGIGDEGTAMLEIIHDLAPGAELYFATAFGGQLGFVNAIRGLAATGCRVIVDDIGYFAEPQFEDGPIAQVGDSVNTEGVAYYAAAGNSGDGRHWGGEFSPVNGGSWHAWDGVSDSTLAVTVPPSGRLDVFIKWNDRWGASGNDYDLFLSDRPSFDLDEGRGLVGVGGNWQTGLGDPYEQASYINDSLVPKTIYIGVHLYDGEARYLDLTMLGGRDPEYWTPYGSIWGHPNARGVMAVAAMNQDSAILEGGGQIAPYSSRGPANIYFPQWEYRHKPDLTGVDGVQITGAGGFGSNGRFFGTSAAAPHIAALAALLLEANPDWGSHEVNAALKRSATDYGEPGPDLTYGYGLANVLAAYETSLGTEVSGDIASATWRKPYSPYILSDTLRIRTGETVTIEAGVDVVFGANAPLIVEGTLIADGAFADSVRFFHDLDSTVAWGGIRFVSGGNGMLRYTRVSGGRAVSSENEAGIGGGVFAGPGSALLLEHVALNANASDSLGGGFGAVDADVEFWNVAFVGNTAPAGGGLYLENVDAELHNVTIAGNNADSASALALLGGAISIRNSIVWGNTIGAPFLSPDSALTISYAIVEGGYEGDSVIDTDPLFAGLDDGDVRLLPGSPAIDAGDMYAQLDPDGTRRDLGAVPTVQTINRVLELTKNLSGSPGDTAISIPIFALAEDAREVSLTMLIDSTMLVPAERFFGYSGFKGAPTDSTWVWSVSGDTIRVASIRESIATESFDGSSDAVMIELLFDVREEAKQGELFGLHWIPFPATYLDRQVASLVQGAFRVHKLPDAVAGASETRPPRFALAQNAPNPFNPRTSLRFSIGEAGAVRLAIYDVNGRLVRTLVDADLPAGHHEAVWNGRDENGRRVASGLYVYRLSSGDEATVRRMVLVR